MMEPMSRGDFLIVFACCAVKMCIRDSTYAVGEFHGFLHAREV